MFIPVFFYWFILVDHVYPSFFIGLYWFILVYHVYPSFFIGLYWFIMKSHVFCCFHRVFLHNWNHLGGVDFFRRMGLSCWNYDIPNYFWEVIKFHGSSHHQPDIKNMAIEIIDLPIKNGDFP